MFGVFCIWMFVNQTVHLTDLQWFFNWILKTSVHCLIRHGFCDSIPNGSERRCSYPSDVSSPAILLKTFLYALKYQHLFALFSSLREEYFMDPLLHVSAVSNESVVLLLQLVFQACIETLPHPLSFGSIYRKLQCKSAKHRIALTYSVFYSRSFILPHPMPLVSTWPFTTTTEFLERLSRHVLRVAAFAGVI